MSHHCRHHCGRLHLLSTRRHYGTKYAAKVTSTSSKGRTISAEVSLIPPLPTDSRGYPIPRRHIICKATQILLQNRRRTSSSTSHRQYIDPVPFLSLQDYLSSLSVTLTPSEASEILKSLNCPSLALKFFHLCPSLSANFRHDPFTYTRLILILAKSTLPDKLELVRTTLSDMERNGVRGTISTVNILIGLFGKGEDLERCIGLVKKWGLRTTGYTYKCLVQAYLRSRDSEKGFGVYVEMKRKGYKLDIFAYNMLLDALAKDQKHFGRFTMPKRFSKT